MVRDYYRSKNAIFASSLYEQCASERLSFIESKSVSYLRDLGAELKDESIKKEFSNIVYSYCSCIFSSSGNDHKQDRNYIEALFGLPGLIQGNFMYHHENDTGLFRHWFFDECEQSAIQKSERLAKPLMGIRKVTLKDFKKQIPERYCSYKIRKERYIDKAIAKLSELLEAQRIEVERKFAETLCACRTKGVLEYSETFQKSQYVFEDELELKLKQDKSMHKALDWCPGRAIQKMYQDNGYSLSLDYKPLAKPNEF